jgi:hypothetical protein
MGYIAGDELKKSGSWLFNASLGNYSWQISVHPNGGLTQVCVDFDDYEKYARGCYDVGQGFTLFKGLGEDRCMLQNFSKNIRAVDYGLRNGIFGEYLCDVEDQCWKGYDIPNDSKLF